jgi:hypothetical protein
VSLGLSVYADGESGCGKEDPLGRKKLTAGDLMAAETTAVQSVYNLHTCSAEEEV